MSDTDTLLMQGIEQQTMGRFTEDAYLNSVSYTHLTLPTIYSV